MSCSAAAAALSAMLGLSGCESAPQSSGARASFAADLGQPGARVDGAQARAVISAYRINQGLLQLSLDERLQKAAEREAVAMAAADKPASADAVKRRLRADGINGPEVNLSAGYRSLAEAFSGWRGSPAHDRVMRASGATKMGIAAAYAPGSKYKVYWALVLAE
jgi:uncharacterized protein YkwD